MELRRTRRRHSAISIVSLIDVMMILLIFFMITSTYLDLNMIPAVQQSDTPVDQPAPPNADRSGATTLLIRLGADGRAHVQGKPLDLDALGALITARLVDTQGLQIVVLPSPRASTQALISVMDRATKAGAAALRIVRLEALP